MLAGNIEKGKSVIDSDRQSGASLVRVLRVHLHPLKFGKGCNAPVLRGIFNTEDQQSRENFRIHGLKWTFCTRPLKTLTRPLPAMSWYVGLTLTFLLAFAENLPRRENVWRIVRPFSSYGDNSNWRGNLTAM